MTANSADAQRLRGFFTETGDDGGFLVRQSPNDAGPVVFGDWLFGQDAGLSLTQGSRFDDADTFFGATLRFRIQLDTRFDAADTFFAGTVSISAVGQTVTQDATFTAPDTFFGGAVTGAGEEPGFPDPGLAWPAPSGYYRRKKVEPEKVEEAVEEVAAIAEAEGYKISPKQLERMVSAAARKPAQDLSRERAAIAELKGLIAAEAQRKAIERAAADLATILYLQEARRIEEEDDDLLLLAA